jgi:hypothetical protein
MQTKRVFWQFPWGYKESFAIATGLIMIGFMLEFFSSKHGLQMPPYPLNLFVLLVFIGYIIGTYIFLRKNPIVKWLSSIPAAISSVSAYTILVLLMGFIPQGNLSGWGTSFGLTYLQKSMPFAICTVFVLTSLGYTLLKRLSHGFSLRNIAFYMNHLGLFIILTTASLGTGDMLRLRMPVHIGQSTNIAQYDTHHMAKLDFEIGLKNFTVEQYPPELLLFDRKTGYPVLEKGAKHPFIKTSKQGTIKEYSFSILEYIEYAVPAQNSYIESDRYGTTQAALLQITGKDTIVEGWISNGNFMYPPVYLHVNDQYVFGMSKPKVQKYASEINVSENAEFVVESQTIEVNKPFKYKSWKIYQYSYDSELGRWSQQSVFELIRDPWLPVVYTGIFMMLLGSMYLLWVGRSLQINSKESNNNLNKE